MTYFFHQLLIFIVYFVPILIFKFEIFSYYLFAFPSATPYTIRVFTGDVRGAGTNANVFLTLYGDRGDSGERKLVKSETHMDKFERNQVFMKFIFMSL